MADLVKNFFRAKNPVGEKALRIKGKRVSPYKVRKTKHDLSTGSKPECLQHWSLQRDLQRTEIPCDTNRNSEFGIRDLGCHIEIRVSGIKAVFGFSRFLRHAHPLKEWGHEYCGWLSRIEFSGLFMVSKISPPETLLRGGAASLAKMWILHKSSVEDCNYVHKRVEVKGDNCTCVNC